MNKLIFSALVLSGMTANAQVKNGMVGINTDEPRATMHIEPGVSESKGLIIPRITAAQMKTMTNLAHFGADHHAIITYLKEDLPSADQTGKLAEVKEAGYYFYNHTAGKWQKFGGGGEQDFKVIPAGLFGRNNYLTKDAGVGGNGASVGTGEGNIAIGTNAFYYNTTGSNNIAQGLYALHQNTTGHHNIAQGEGALYSNNTGNYNIAQGYWALQHNTTGANNIAIGESALKGQLATPITGNYNIALGAKALQNTTSGNHNIAQGYQALYSNTTGISNIAQGQEALYSNTTGKFNIAQGDGALKANTTGDFNVAQGYQALHSNTTGGGNVAQGNSVLRNNTTGENNVAQGQSALYNNTTGSHNTAMGVSSGKWIKGNANIHIGLDTDEVIPNASGELNNVIAIGHFDSQSTTYSLNTTTANDNVILLGNTSPDAPKVGVGTYKPQAKLHVEGNIKVGNENNTCNADTEGSIRYNKPTKKFQGCDGTNWVNLN